KRTCHLHSPLATSRSQNYISNNRYLSASAKPQAALEERPMSEAITETPPPELPPRRRGWTWSSWTVILLAVAAIIGSHFWPIAPKEEAAAGKETSRMALIMLELQR